MPTCTTTSPLHTPQCSLSLNSGMNCVAYSSSSATTKHTKETSLHPKNKHMRTSTTNTTMIRERNLTCDTDFTNYCANTPDNAVHGDFGVGVMRKTLKSFQYDIY